LPVTHMRIDNRLIHGQVTVSWVGTLNADHLIVSNDDVAADDMQKMILPQAARGVKTSILSIDETLDYVKSSAGDNEKIMLIAKFPSDALRLIEGGMEPKEINVGNQAPLPGSKFKMVKRTIAITGDDAAALRKIAEKGYRLNARMMPSDRSEDFVKLMEKKGL
jgi:mannose/fructose/N-acetylgalactosamine-specific phosphotransferase system component IIB